MDGVCQPRAPAVPLWQRLGAYSVPLLALAVFGGFSVRFLQFSATSDWGTCFVPAALCLAKGEAMPVTYAYPPAMAMLSLPLARLPLPGRDVAWYLVNVLAACIAFSCAWRLAGGPTLLRLSRKWHAVLALALLLAGRFFISPLENTQFDMIIACLLLAGCCRLWRGCELSAGLLLGASAAMKLTPLLFLPYLLWRRRWRAALLMIAVIGLLNALPDLLWPQLSGTSYLVDWYRNTLRPLEGHAPGIWHTAILFNQSLSGLFNRWVSQGDAISGQRIALVRGLTWGAAAVLLSLTAWRLGRPWRSLPLLSRDTSRPVAWTELRLSIEAGLGLCLMLLLSPMSGKAHYVVLILPVLLLARRLIEQPRAGSILLMCCLLVTGPLCAKDLVGDRAGELTLFWGFPTFFALLCFGGLWLLHGRVLRRFPMPREAPYYAGRYDGLPGIVVDKLISSEPHVM